MAGWRRLFGLLCGIVTFVATEAPLRAQERSNVLRAVVDPALIESGLIDWLTPRFRFKSRLTLAAAPPPVPDAALAILRDDQARSDHPDRARTPVAERGEDLFVAVVLAPAGEGGDAKRLVSWLISDAGKRALAGFKPEDGLSFAEPGAGGGEVAPVVADAMAVEGERLALLHCGRCHVVSEKNKYGGIGSTPSFPALKTLPDFEIKFEAFWTLNPHPSFTQVEGITPPFDPARPPHIAPVELTFEDVQAIAAYVAGIAPKDLGAPVQGRSVGAQ